MYGMMCQPGLKKTCMKKKRRGEEERKKRAETAETYSSVINAEWDFLSSLFICENDERLFEKEEIAIPKLTPRETSAQLVRRQLVCFTNDTKAKFPFSASHLLWRALTALRAKPDEPFHPF